MVQLRKKLLLILLVICFCLFQIIAVAYGTGVTIDFSNFSLGNIQWGATNNNPSSQPTQPTPPPPLLIPTTVNTTTSSSTPITNSNISNLTNFTSSYQKFNSPSGQSPISSIDTHKLTKELTQSVPVTFGSLPENEPLLPSPESYIVTVCLSFNNMPASGCSDKATSTQASEKLAEIILDKYFKGTESRPFRVVMSSTMTMAQQKELLHQIEIQAMTLVETGIFKSNGTFIKEYDKVAREEAERGVNWSHTSKDNKSIHDFYTKKAFTRLNNIAIQEKKLSSKNFKNN
ncbi:MAG: hypothetical protein CVU62_05015 [Deltaproteobacteria bacterium HGW-Deltaproteobacteria-2]|jgi:hypothetical protein|nr:MAG: hypothetical protein CVU62_05015 [Deltaproteobacteria bacterium HGW-Deltaproteobacteria-2]